MGPVNVLINAPIGDELLLQITNVSPRIRLSNVYELARAEQSGDFARKDELDALLAEAEN